MLFNLDFHRRGLLRVDDTNPFFAMFSAWTAPKTRPLGDALYSYQNSITVYDENGAPPTC
jgi:hypothetical protein